MKEIHTINEPLSFRWRGFLAVALLAGIFLRMTFVEDMEYKEDEEYNFIQSQLIGNSQPWPWYGIASGVYIVNPGMSIWVFAVLAKLFGIHSPTSLAHAVQGFALFGMCLILPFAIQFLKGQERRIWLWSLALALVNPFLVLYHRKLWPEGFLPFFTMLTLMGWWKKEKFWGAFIWGWMGAWLGQVHMSGFFFSAALFGWTLGGSLIFLKEKLRSTHWKAWFAGSVFGALPLIPWALYSLQHPIQNAITRGWNEIIQLKYWVFWMTDPLGLHLGNPLGLLRGPSQWDQISDFIRYPLIGEHSTYLVGMAHLGVLLAATCIYGTALYRGIHQRLKHKGKGLIASYSQTAFVQNAAFWGCGALLTLSGVMIRRYYMTVTFPLEYIFLTRMANPEKKTGKRLLAILWVCELFISAQFVGYIHFNGGSTQGDYGRAYRTLHPQDPSP